VRLGLLQSWSWHSGEEQDLLLLLGIEPLFICCLACDLLNIPTMPPCNNNNNNNNNNNTGVIKLGYIQDSNSENLRQS
jgi:hypothetical protein